MCGGILSLNEETIQLLRDKYPETSEADDNNMLQGPCDRINTILFEEIDEALSLKQLSKQKEDRVPWGLTPMAGVESLRQRCLVIVEKISEKL